MPRHARLVAVGVAHHITHRGNNRQDVFLLDEDRRRYQDLIREQLKPCGVDLLGWCWMTNHVHLIAVPRGPDSLASIIMRVHSRYTQDFNRRYKRTGHLWHSRFYSCVLGLEHLRTAMLYGDHNPVRAWMVGEADAYPWSSAAAHVSGEDKAQLLSPATLQAFGGCQDWVSRLSDAIDGKQASRRRSATQSGTPLASVDVIEKLEREFGRKLTLRPAGRPRKQNVLAQSVGESH